MTTITKTLPMDIIYHILSYDIRFTIRKGNILKINKIHNIERTYEILSTIPNKNYDPEEDMMFVYLGINSSKNFILTYKNSEINIDTLFYKNDRFCYMEMNKYIIS